MQGDIFQLSTIQQQGPKAGPLFETKTQPPVKQQRVGATHDYSYVSIFNEDDLSHMLFHQQHRRPFDDLEVHGHATAAQDHARYLGAIASAFDDYCLDTPYDDSDDCAIYSDVDDDDYSGPVTPVEHHRSSTVYSAPEFHLEVLTAAKIVSAAAAAPAPVQVTHPKKQAPVQAQEAQPEHRQEGEDAIPSAKHVTTIQGHLMSWWPLPTDMEEYDWDDGKEDINERHCRQVAEIDGKMMSWWPLPEDSNEYDWDPRFYE